MPILLIPHSPFTPSTGKQVAQTEDNETDKAWVKFKEQKPHFLVTAPSNVAVDNILPRICEDETGKRYNPQRRPHGPLSEREGQGRRTRSAGEGAVLMLGCLKGGVLTMRDF